jgi:hypothetical protein
MFLYVNKKFEIEMYVAYILLTFWNFYHYFIFWLRLHHSEEWLAYQ